MGIPVRCISLARSAARLDVFMRDNGAVPGLSVYPAIEGALVMRPALVAHGLAHDDALVHYSNGALGCALSHRELWLECIQADAPITICEDDAILHRDFGALSEQAVARFTDGLDLILWGWNFDAPMSFLLPSGYSPCAAVFDQNQLRASIGVFRETPVAPAYFRLQRAFGTVCYTVTPRGAKRLLQQCFPLRPLTVYFPILNGHIRNNGIDIVMNALYPALDAYVAFPPLVVTRNEHSQSTVQSVAQGPSTAQETAPHPGRA